MPLQRLSNGKLTGKMVCGGCGAVCDYVEALPKGVDDGSLATGSPVSTTHEFIHISCAHPNRDEGKPSASYHEPHDHAGVVAFCRQENREAPPSPVAPGTPLTAPSAGVTPPPPPGS